ncbi:MAG TPA: AMP-binding protein [Candidatus Dormibacteraeota bacterium]|nr:AMP-binding protein [Candidatus Dormibacteraeota bacterium]
MLTAQRLVERSLAAYRNRVFVIDQHGERTYGEVGLRSARLANALLALGSSATRPTTIFLPNDSRFIEIDLACMRAGITRVAISTRLSADECQFIVNHSQSAVLVTNEGLLSKLDRNEFDELKAILLVDAKAESYGAVRNYESVVSQGRPELTVSPVLPGHSAYILYTSGTTGRPKGATHTHASRVAAAINMLSSEVVANRHSTMVHCAPLTHGSGSKVLSFMAAGARNLILPRFEPEEFARAVQTHGGTHSFMVPIMLQMLIDSGDKVCNRVRKMAQISFGGAPISNVLFGRSLEELGPILTQVYGSCEAPHPITVMRPDDYLPAPDPSAMAESAGRATHATEIRVLDDDGRVVRAGIEGELVVRADHLMRGYWRDDEATAAVIDREGWYATGDVAIVDEQGFVYFKDRKRDLIISGGLNIYPSEVERVLACHPGVREVTVVSYPDKHWGESVLACIVPRDGAAISESGIIEWIADRIASYKKPRKVLFMAELPKGSTNKVLKRELKAKLWEGKARRIN